MVRSLVQRKYDKDSKLWIPDYYVLYAYWYRFLQIAVEENRDIDWTRYEGWGGSEVIQNTKFRKWWLEHWKELFGVKTELGVSRSSRRFRLSTKKPKRNGIKVALRVYENKHRGENWEIMEYLNKKYVEDEIIEYDYYDVVPVPKPRLSRTRVDYIYNERTTTSTTRFKFRL